MDSILQQITDWLKEMLISAIMGNLSGMFESVNNQVGEIATSVGRTPESFSPEIFAMVRNISESVIIPIAGLILTFIACYELIQLIIDHNNLANFETWIFFKWVFKTFVAVMLITNTFNITMAVFDVAQHVVNASGGIIAGNTAIDASGLEALEETLQGMDLGPLIGLLLQSFVVQITMSALAIIIFVIVYGRMIEIYLMVSLAPIPFSTFANREQNQIGQNYLRSLYDKAEKLVSKSDKANVNALFEKFKKDNPNASSNPLSRWRQKHNIKKEYAAARAGKGGKATAKGAGKTAKGVKSLTQKIADFCVSHKTALLWVLAIGLLFMVISGMFSACSTMFQGGTQVVLGTSFTAEDEDILGTDEDYTALENDLRSQVDNIESTHPGYDEYRYALDEIGHNPYELAAYLTVVFEDYTREEVQAELVRLFEEQYDLELDEEVEIRSYTTTDEDGNTSTVYYEYRILNVTLTNYGLGNVIASSRLTAEQWERYKVLLETLGNRSYLFGEDVSSAPGGGGEYTDYDIPGEALTDTAFANMVREAEKYLGYPYVWGGSSPSTSFDCSGFVSWVINNCGNGWSVGRQTANGLKNLCDIIPPSEAKPGDLIFFQGTYNTSGASHVGIYVGNGMMIHCGDPISYASIETNYWQQHFYCFGRIP